jgi:hypothetical protein
MSNMSVKTLSLLLLLLVIAYFGLVYWVAAHI